MSATNHYRARFKRSEAKRKREQLARVAAPFLAERVERLERALSSIAYTTAIPAADIDPTELLALVREDANSALRGAT